MRCPAIRKASTLVVVALSTMFATLGFSQQDAGTEADVKSQRLAEPAIGPIMDRAPIVVEKNKHLPNQGGFRNGQDMWDWLGGAGDIWWDGGNPVGWIDTLKKFVAGENSDAMKEPRPKKVKLYMQGSLPKLPQFTYQQCANNVPEVKAQWVAMAKVCVDAGYKDCVFGSSETQHGKKWKPSKDDILSGRWKKAWINMVDDVRSIMPEAKFAFVPFTGNQTEERGMVANPDNGLDEKDLWYVAEKDAASRPYMDFWGSTVYFGTHPAGRAYPAPVTKDLLDTCMKMIRTPVTNCHTNWAFMGNYQYAKEKGIKLVIGEIGITYRDDAKKMAMGDQPYAIDLLTKLMYDCSDQIEFVCWFNLRSKMSPSGSNSLDAKSYMPHAAQRVRELWGPDSPYRKQP